MTKTTKRLAAVAMITAGVASVAAIAPTYAQQRAAGNAAAPMAAHALHMPGGGPGARLGIDPATYDADGDGIITQAEIDAARAAVIAQYDTDGDGSLSLEEYQALWLDLMRERIVDAFQALDADGDGIITVEEFNRGFANLVARLDRNGDGGLSADDRPARAAAEPTAEQGRPGPGPQHGGMVIRGFGFGVGPGR